MQSMVSCSYLSDTALRETVIRAHRGLTFRNRDRPIRCYWVTPCGKIAYHDNQIPKQGVQSDELDRPVIFW